MLIVPVEDQSAGGFDGYENKKTNWNEIGAGSFSNGGSGVDDYNIGNGRTTNYTRSLQQVRQAQQKRRKRMANIGRDTVHQSAT